MPDWKRAKAAACWGRQQAHAYRRVAAGQTCDGAALLEKPGIVRQARKQEICRWQSVLSEQQVRGRAGGQMQTC